MRIVASSSIRKMLDPGLTFVLLLTLFNIVPIAESPGPADGSGAFEVLRWLPLASLLACGGGMYLFCRRRSGGLGAALAGLLYAYSPYLTVAEAYARGVYPEWLAFALFPLLLWRIDALRDQPSPANFAAVFLLQISLSSAQDSMALLLTAIAIAWVSFETAIQRFNREASQMSAWSGLLALLAVLLGIAASATFWLPALLESGSPPAEKLANAGLLDEDREFLGLRDLLLPAPIQDAAAINGLGERRVLGSAQWMAALMGALGAAALYIRSYRTRHPQTFLGAAYFGALALTLICLMTPSAAEIWAGLLSSQLLEFPGRLLGPLAACLAIVASMNGIWLEGLARRYQVGLIALAIALPIVTAIPLLYAPEWRRTQLEPSTSLYQEAAMDGDQRGASAADDSHPRDAQSARTHDFALMVSAASIVGLCLALWFLRNQDQTVLPYGSNAGLSGSSLLGILLGGGIALLTFAFTFREGIAWFKSPPGEALPAQVRLKYTLEDSLQLLGYDLSGEAWRAGETLALSAYWLALEDAEADFSSFLYLSQGGGQVARSQRQPPGGRPIKDWRRPGGYVVDRYMMLIPGDLPAGDYDLMLGLTLCQWKPAAGCDAGSEPIARDESGELARDGIKLASIRVDAG